MDDIKEILSQLSKFNRDRDWELFHNPKDLAIAIYVDANKLNQLIK